MPALELDAATVTMLYRVARDNASLRDVVVAIETQHPSLVYVPHAARPLVEHDYDIADDDDDDWDERDEWDDDDEWR